MSVSSNPTKPSHIGAWRMRFINFWLRITEPEPSLPEPERRQARILSALVVALIIITVLATALIFILTKTDHDLSTTDYDFRRGSFGRFGIFTIRHEE